jgi:hypothetical protein
LPKRRTRADAKTTGVLRSILRRGPGSRWVRLPASALFWRALERVRSKPGRDRCFLLLPGLAPGATPGLAPLFPSLTFPLAAAFLF